MTDIARTHRYCDSLLRPPPDGRQVSRRATSNRAGLLGGDQKRPRLAETAREALRHRGGDRRSIVLLKLAFGPPQAARGPAPSSERRGS